MSEPDESIPESERPTLKFPVGEELLPMDDPASPVDAGPDPDPIGAVTSNPGPEILPAPPVQIYTNPGPPKWDEIKDLDDEDDEASSLPPPPPSPPPRINPGPVDLRPPKINPGPPPRTNPGPPRSKG